MKSSDKAHEDLIGRLQEPREGIHENGEEELKSWDTLWEQCQEAAKALAAVSSAKLPTNEVAMMRGWVEAAHEAHDKWLSSYYDERKLDKAIEADTFPLK